MPTAILLVDKVKIYDHSSYTTRPATRYALQFFELNDEGWKNHSSHMEGWIVTLSSRRDQTEANGFIEA